LPRRFGSVTLAAVQARAGRGHYVAMQPLVMTPEPGERLLRFVGDQISFRLSVGGGPLPEGWQARLRTNIGRGDSLRREIILAQAGRLPLAQAAWRDVPMKCRNGVWTHCLSLTETGFFKAKAYAVDENGRQYWPEGPDFGVSVHPDAYRTANTIYCAFPRMFGDSRTAKSTVDEKLEHVLASLDEDGYTVIPPSGKLRDLIEHLPHIIDRLGCRILHLLPINPTPTTYARFGRFGSPYAVQDLLAIDPALVVFDKKTTGVDQFRELTWAAHARGARVFLDVVINHTGWGSTLQENHPEWYLRDSKGSFVCPGAWGVVWEDLVELDHRAPALWEHLAEVFLEWCRRGVDGFRCDAGYKIPVPAWRYITARVLHEFPDTIFLLEGLGGSWLATENLLTEGGMQWAYSELFQNHSRQEVAGYLDYAMRQSERIGLYVHYSETHDNDRLARLGREWSLLRNQLCGLASASGGFGFTCGVEWLAVEKLQVHQSRGLSWDNPQNIISELARLNRLLTEHPCFFDGAALKRLSRPEDHVFALSRISSEGDDRLLVMVNTDARNAHTLKLERAAFERLGSPRLDLLGSPGPELRESTNHVEFSLQGGQCFCLAATTSPRGLSGERYRESHAQSAWAITMISRRIRVRDISAFDWRRMAALVEAGPAEFLAAVSQLEPALVKEDVIAALEAALGRKQFPQVVTWDLVSRRRVTLLPAEHWLLLEDTVPFRASLRVTGGVPAQNAQSIRIRNRHVVAFVPGQPKGSAVLSLERYAESDPHIEATLEVISLPQQLTPGAASPEALKARPVPVGPNVLLTNGRGGMARLAVDLGRIDSKYDCLLGANLHPTIPVDRHILAKRVRVWVNADGFLSPLDLQNLAEFIPGPPARWRFVATAGDDRAVEILLTVDMLEGHNTTVLHFQRPAGPVPVGRDLAPECRVALTVRVDIEDRNFHSETHHNGGADHHFNSHTHLLARRTGFEFTPARERQLRVYSDGGAFHHQPEWCDGITHPIEQSRGQVGSGDAYSPGWFELPLAKGTETFLTVTADDPAHEPGPAEITGFAALRESANAESMRWSGLPGEDWFGRQLALSLRAFVVRRGEEKTVIAGYPWFLDWGRDSLIAARGLLAAGMREQVKELLRVFGRFEEQGTLPNTINGEDASNRETSDAALWYGIVVEDFAASEASVYQLAVDTRGRTIADVLRGIGEGYRRGTSNGIRMDAASGLIWSPSHFTWMDTNYPAGTPREGYPVEIQVLWVRLLRQLARLNQPTEGEGWAELAGRAERSMNELFWLDREQRLADLLRARPGQAAANATVDDALRSNSLFAVSLGVLGGDRARRTVDAALRYLVIPGALRSLAPLPVSLPLEVKSANGDLLNTPAFPYWGRYEGDEDTRRKPAYHNGTAWTWTFPVFCEALAQAWDFSPPAVAAARQYLGSMLKLMEAGCLTQLPEIVDGDAPHAHRGCDAQAWSASEALRVWKKLHAP